MRLNRNVGLIIVAWSNRTVSRRRDANVDVPAISQGEPGIRIGPRRLALATET
jgi:hypothetical protein